MHLLAQEEYGLRCLLNVARHPGPGELTIPEVAAAEGLSPEYTAKLMRVLRQGGLVASIRGASGGYHLARPASAITIWEAIQVLGGSLFPEDFCDTHPGQQHDCVHATDCSIRALWRVLDNAVDRILKGITLADLLPAENSTVVRFGALEGGGVTRGMMTEVPAVTAPATVNARATVRAVTRAVVADAGRVPATASEGSPGERSI